MFASPPPEPAILPQINPNNNSNSTFTTNQSEMRSLYSITSNITTTTNSSNGSSNRSLFNGTKFIHNLPLPHSGTSDHTERNFINTPREYTNKARDEIKQLMIPQHTTNNHTNSITPTTTRNSVSQTSDIASYQSSVFSRPSIQTNNSTYTTGSLNKKFSLPPLNFVTEITLNDALPQSYQDMYSVETLSTSPLLPNGRPQFTQRALIDWELNDLRSLLIVDKLRPEWGNSIPVVVAPTKDIQLRIILLPLVCNENVIIDTLVSSDIYMEAGLDLEFKWNTAKYIVEQVKRKHQQLQNINYDNNNNVIRLNKIEWRNIIENYLLNIAVGVQCRFDFKQRCSDFKKWKWDNLVENSKDGENIPKIKIVLTKDEKSILWSQCQAQVYQRLGLDWKPDKV
ncbi:protein Std1p [Monosporozyma unispora]